jgi:hypothetical protein
MTELPERIWALADRRKYWQEESPQDGQHDWHWTEYTRTDKAQARVAELEAALFAVRNEICIGPTLDTLWHSSVPAETTVDYICNILQDDWDYDEWLTTHETLKGKTDV